MTVLYRIVGNRRAQAALLAPMASYYEGTGLHTVQKKRHLSLCQRKRIWFGSKEQPCRPNW
jgi:hypothetical protein